MNTSIVPASMYEAHNAYRRLRMSLDMENVKTAIIEVRTFLKIYPDTPIACNDLGVLYQRDGEKLLALACYEKANRLQPGAPDTVKNLAEFYFVELGWADDAILMLTELLRSAPEDCDLLTKLGIISEKVGRNEEATVFYSRVLELEPYNHEVKDALARLGGKPLQSPPIPAAPEPEPICPPSVPPAGQSGQLEEILAGLRKKMGLSETETAQPATPAETTTENLLAEARECAEAGNPEAAAAKLERLITAEPENALAHNDLGVVYTTMDRPDKACLHHENAVRLHPSNLVFRKNLAALYYSLLGRTDEAIGIYTALLKEQPDDVETLTALAIIAKNNHLRDQARTFIGRVLNLEPWNNDAREFLATI